MRIILTRHGETIANKQGIIQGHLPGKLSEKGKEQAKRVAERLKHEKIDIIYSSDLARTADTIKEIVKFHPNIPVHFVKELRERNLGEFQGKKEIEVPWVLEKGKKAFPPVKQGESREEMYNRAKNFLEKIFNKHKNKTVLFAGHDGINKALFCVIRGKPADHIREVQDFGNTSITIFDIDDKKNHKIHVFNCTQHLT